MQECLKQMFVTNQLLDGAACTRHIALVIEVRELKKNKSAKKKVEI